MVAIETVSKETRKSMMISGDVYVLKEMSSRQMAIPLLNIVVHQSYVCLNDPRNEHCYFMLTSSYR